MQVPGSKSYTNRALILAALSNGKSVLKNALLSDDTEYMINALRELGADIKIDGTTITVIGGELHEPKKELYCGNAGTCMRFLTAMTSALNIKCKLNGDEQMKKRPIGDLIDALIQLGGDIIANNGAPPVHVVRGIIGGNCTVSPHISSQFISALLMAAPYCEKNVTIRVNGELISRPYVYMTISAMNKFNVNIISKFEPDYTLFEIRPRKYKPCVFEVEGDASSATYFWAFSKLLDKKIVIENVPSDSLQGDADFKTLIEKFSPGEFDMNEMPDSVPTLAVFAAFQKGQTVIRNVANLRVKECDRIHALATELKKIGCKCEELDDGLIINCDPDSLHAAEIETYSDHRIAMSFALAKAMIPGVTIKNPECVSKTYPNFWDDYAKFV